METTEGTGSKWSPFTDGGLHTQQRTSQLVNQEFYPNNF
jgi:hypothetical protein